MTKSKTSKRTAPRIVLAAVKSISDLAYRAAIDPRYERLAVLAGQNLGGSCRTLNEAIRWLETNAMETDESGVVGEINFCRDLVAKES